MTGPRSRSLLVASALVVLALGAAAPAPAATRTFSQCLTTWVPVIDFGTQGIGANVRVPHNAARGQHGVVKKVSAGVQVTHTADSDLVLSLVSPAGRAIALASSRGGSGDGYGSPPLGCSGSLVGFDDAAATPIATPGNVGNNPILGTFRPEQPFSTFTGGPAAGSWMLVMTDRAAGDQGASIRAFQFSITYTYKKTKKKKK